MAYSTGTTLLTTVSSRTDMSGAIRAAAVLFVAVLTAVAAQVSIPLPFTPVPFTLQPMIVLRRRRRARRAARDGEPGPLSARRASPGCPSLPPAPCSRRASSGCSGRPAAS